MLARSALVDGTIGVVVAPFGHLVVVLAVTIEGDRITHIEMLAGKETVAALSVRTVASMG